MVHQASADMPSEAASVRTARPGGSHIAQPGSAAAQSNTNGLAGVTIAMARSGSGTLTTEIAA